MLVYASARNRRVTTATGNRKRREDMTSKRLLATIVWVILAFLIAVVATGSALIAVLIACTVALIGALAPTSRPA